MGMSGLEEGSCHGRKEKPTTEFHVARVRLGDPSSFAPLYERIAPSLDAWARLRVTAALRGHVEPGDLVQEVWWRAMDAFDRYDPERSEFRPWLFRIATNVLLEWYRARQRRVRVEPEILGRRTRSLPPALARQATSVGRGVARRESVKTLVAVVMAMSEENRATFVQCGLEGKTAADAAVVIGLSEAAVKKRWTRLREKLSRHPVWRDFDPAEE